MTYHCGKKACFGRGCKCVCADCCAARAEELQEQREGKQDPTRYADWRKNGAGWKQS